MTRQADLAAKIIAAVRIRRESGRRGAKDDHLADCRDGQADNDQGTPSQRIPIVNREPRPTTAATQPVSRPSTLSLPNRSAYRIAVSRTGGRRYRLVMPARPQMLRARLQHMLADTGALMRDGACSITPVAGRHPPVGAPVVVGRRQGGGVTNLVEAAAHNSSGVRGGRRGGEARAAVPRHVLGLLPPGAVRLRCPGERNGACRWLRPVRKSSDALIRAVGMSCGRGRRGRQSRSAAGCRTRWPGSRIWR